jgi:hypothetical protein
MRIAGCTYSHSFLPGDKPPVFFDGKEPPPEYDIILERGASTKDKTKDDLVRDLEAEEINAKGNVPVLKERCRQAGILLQKILDRLTAGYVGKPKATLQVAYERGFIEEERRWQDCFLGRNDRQKH